MGITGLIPFLEKASSKVHLKDLRGCTVAVDSYCWLHRGVYTCAEKLVRGEDTDLYVQFCLKYVTMLLSYDIKPILVFDGRHLPAKALTERRRRESRQESKKRAAELLRLGKTEEARSHMRRCVDVTHAMALRLIRECRLRNVDCIVAPYEADAQMAWLNKVDLAQYVITEDSDLTLFGARKIIFKLDLTGAGLYVDADKLHLAMGCRIEKYNFDKFRRMCILSGCDYLDSLPGIGLAKSCKFMLKTEEDNMWRALKKIPQYLNMRQLEVDDEYIDKFLKAEATFRHMYIYNPLKRGMERLHALEDFQTEERFCCNAGILLDDTDQALQLALGNLDPFTMQKLDNWHPDRDFALAQAPPQNTRIKRAKHKSIWHANFTKHNAAKQTTDGTPTASCALYFKKVDFISKTIDEEISANIKAECEKPEEAEIFSMYKSGSMSCNYENTLETKRKRIDSNASNNSATSREDNSPTRSPAANKARLNPFMKLPNPTESAQSSPAVCENGSLLKMLSPKKCKENISNVAMRNSNSFRRSIFAHEDAKVEVKSRFFAANIKQVTQPRTSLAFTNTTTPPRSTDFSEVIEKIETRSLENQSKRVELYNSPPSPHSQSKQNEIKEREISSSYAESGIESIDVASITEQQTTTEPEYIEDKQLNSLDTYTIELSDEDAGDNDSGIVATRKFSSNVFKPLNLGMPKSKAKLRGIGLSRKNSNSKSSTKSSISTATDASQTRLSMFGFKKKPTLK